MALPKSEGSSSINSGCRLKPYVYGKIVGYHSKSGSGRITVVSIWDGRHSTSINSAAGKRCSSGLAAILCPAGSNRDSFAQLLQSKPRICGKGTSSFVK